MLANAIGTGVADDKSIYPYVPEMIRFYLGEQPILSNIPTAVPESGGPALRAEQSRADGGQGGPWRRGYGMLVGPRSTKEEREAFRQRLLANPANYIAQTPLRCRPAPPSLMKGRRRGISIYGPYVLSGQGDAAGARRPDPRGPHRRVAGGQLVAGRRNQGYPVMEDDASC